MTSWCFGGRLGTHDDPCTSRVGRPKDNVPHLAGKLPQRISVVHAAFFVDIARRRAHGLRALPQAALRDHDDETQAE